jgi:hypothetical protein
MINKNLIFNWLMVIFPILIYLLVVFLGLLKIQVFLAYFCAGIVGFIYSLSVFILHFKTSNKPEEFVSRYLIMTTVQLLSFLSIITAIIYTDKPRILVYHTLFLFLILLIFQTAGLLYKRK